MKKVLYALFLIPVSLLTMFAAFYLFSKEEPLFSTKNIRIHGAQQLKESEIMEKISPYLKENLFGIDVEKINSAMSLHPYVREVRVKRVFPFALLIDIKEKQPSALWVNPKGELLVVDERGEPYRRLARNEKRDVFLIYSENKGVVKSIYDEVGKWEREGIIKKNAISEIAYHEGNITLFGNDEGVEIMLGKEEQRARLKRALAILDDAKKRGLVIRCIDARFERGAIIQERKGSDGQG